MTNGKIDTVDTNMAVKPKDTSAATFSEGKKFYDEERLEAAQKRRILVCDYVLQGLSQTEIIIRLKEDHNIAVSQSSISNDMRMMENGYLERIKNAKKYDVERAKDLERIEKMIGALWITAVSGSVNAIKTIATLLERKAKMLGYDEPAKVDIKNTIIKMAIEAKQDPALYLEAAGLIINGDDLVS